MKTDITEKIDRLTGITEVEYPQSKEEIWDILESKLSDKNLKPTKVRKLSFRHPAVAASIVLLLGLGFIMRFYTLDCSTAAGEQMAVTLPDGSAVDLNGQTTLEYHPFWWRLNRTLKFEGEGYFEVEKGKRFSVESKNGTTTVLGTSFNIYARDSEYEVNCLTGKVQVAVSDEVSEVITPNQQAKLTENKLQVSQTEAIHAKAWREQMFYFTNVSMQRVFREIEIAYNTTIRYKADNLPEYSGNFKKTGNIEDVLHIVCAPVNLKFAKDPSGTYVIKRE